MDAQHDVIVVGAGLAGLATTIECLDRNLGVRLIERGSLETMGGLARRSFGGVMMVDSPTQRRSGIKDSAELALQDWHSFAEFEDGSEWPRLWAERYCSESIPEIYEWLTKRGVQFMPLVNWPERGFERHGNSVPRWHITWGTGYRLVSRILQSLEAHPNRRRLKIREHHKVTDLVTSNGRVVGIRGTEEPSGKPFEVRAQAVVLACGGICGGDLSLVRKHWLKAWGEPPVRLLNGSHAFADGTMHQAVAAAGGRVTHLEKQWHYAAGIAHPRPIVPSHGLSLVPPRSALWCDAQGRRFGPRPLIGYTDTRHLVETITQAQGQYSWLVLNQRIAAKELAVSGTEYMTAFRERRKLLLIKNLLLGNHELVNRLSEECVDVVRADDLESLITRMDQLSLDGLRIDGDHLKRTIQQYDAEIDRGARFVDDEQLRRILHFRRYRGDKIRTCNLQKINDPKAFPLIAIRCFILSRKSLGGMQTDLDCRVLDESGRPLEGLYAVGEAAGFGGGGIHGLRSLEGTFLGACVLTGRAAGRSISGGST